MGVFALLDRVVDALRSFLFSVFTFSRTVAKKVFWEFYYYAKLERHFAIVLYTNMAVSSRN